MPVYTDKRTKRFYIEFQYKGVRVKERLPEGIPKKDAEKLEVKIKNDLMFQSHGIETKTSVVTFDSFVRDTFGPVADAFPRDRYDRTVLLVKAALPFFKGKAMRNIKAADVERFKASRVSLLTMHDTVRKPATVEREMSIISSIFSMAVKNDVIDYNPCSRVKRIAFDNVQDRVLRWEHEDLFFSHIKTEWAADVCKMVLNTGMRQNDLMRLTRFEVRLNENCIRLVQGKTQRRVEIPLNSISREILERRMQIKRELLFASPVTKTDGGSVRMTMIRACVKAEIPPLTIRDLRRTFATRVIQAGADAVTVARLLGHSGLQMVSRYVRTAELMQNAVDSLVNPANPLKNAESSKFKLLKVKG